MKKVLIIITTILLIAVGVLIGYKVLDKKDVENNSLTQENLVTPEKEEKKEEVYTASMIMVGDNLIHSSIYKEANRNANGNGYDFKPMLEYIKPIVSKYDIKYYNQETIFDDEQSYGGFPRFNTPSKFGADMIDAGFNLVSISSNHSMDRGADSAKRSVNWWKNQENVLTNGMASSEEMRTNYQIKEANNITYTMLSYTYGTNGLGGAELSKEPYLVNVFNEELVKNDIAAVRDKVDVLIVSMHWGNEYQQVASETQKAQAKFLADNGVDIVLGTHSHCIQPWEWIDDTVVFYSFGNFISNQMGAEQALVRKVGVIGMFATLDITKTVDTKNNTTTIRVDNIGADLNYTYRYYNSNIGKNDYLVIPFSKMESKYLNNYESVYNEFSEVLKKYDESINIEPLPSA